MVRVGEASGRLTCLQVGLRILVRNFRGRRGEIDMVARHGVWGDPPQLENRDAAF